MSEEQMPRRQVNRPTELRPQDAPPGTTGASESPSALAKPPDGTLNDLEAATLLLDAWKFRQAHCWSLLSRYFVAATLISIAPYGLDRDLALRLSAAVRVLPILGLALALAAIWLYAAEYIRAQGVNHGFKAIIEGYGYYKYEPLRAVERFVLAPRIGWTTVYVLTVATLALGFINTLLVWSALKAP